jgi:mono/diheme cytochrome c family protein
MASKNPVIPPRAKSHFKRPPFWLIAVFIILAVASWIPLVVIARARVSTTTQPRIQIFQDMGVQPNYRPQEPGTLFADGRAMQPKLPGTVARGEAHGDDHYSRGFSRKMDEQSKQWQVTFFQDLPPQVKLTPQVLSRGQERFNIYCAPCHGWDGGGAGPVAVRSVEIGEAINPTSMNDDLVRGRPAGHIYNTIVNGIRTMPPYGSQISVDDRWAIVAYVRALQLRRDPPAELLTPQQLEVLKKQRPAAAK